MPSLDAGVAGGPAQSGRAAGSLSDAQRHQENPRMVSRAGDGRL